MMEKKVRFKMYKRKKQWVVAGLAFISGVVFSVSISTSEVKASEVTPDSSLVQTSPTNQESSDSVTNAIPAASSDNVAEQVAKTSAQSESAKEQATTESEVVLASQTNQAEAINNSDVATSTPAMVADQATPDNTSEAATSVQATTPTQTAPANVADAPTSSQSETTLQSPAPTTNAVLPEMNTNSTEQPSSSTIEDSKESVNQSQETPAQPATTEVNEASATDTKAATTQTPVSDPDLATTPSSSETVSAENSDAANQVTDSQTAETNTTNSVTKAATTDKIQTTTVSNETSANQATPSEKLVALTEPIESTPTPETQTATADPDAKTSSTVATPTPSENVTQQSGANDLKTDQVTDQASLADDSSAVVKEQTTPKPVVAATVKATSLTNQASATTNANSVQTASRVFAVNQVADNASQSIPTAPKINYIPALSNFYVEPNASYVLYNAQAMLELYPYNRTQANEQMYGFYVVLPTSITGVADTFQASADKLVSYLQSTGTFHIDSLTVYQLNNTTDGREVYYFRPNDGAYSTTSAELAVRPKLNLEIKTGQPVASTPSKIQLNANNITQVATNDVLFAGFGDQSVNGGSYPTVAANSLGINAPDQYISGISYGGDNWGIARFMTYTHTTVQDTYKIVDKTTGQVIKTIPVSGQDGSSYERKGRVDTLAALGLDASKYWGPSLTIDSGSLTDSIILTPSNWSTNNPGATTNGSNYTVYVDEIQTKLNTKDSTLIAGPATTWTAQDNLTNLVGPDGKPLNVSDLKVTGTVDTTKTGDYPIQYTYTDTQGNLTTAKAVVSVVASQSKLAGHDSTLIAGPNQKWTAQDNYDAGTDASGKAIDFNQVTVEGTVDPTKAGDYPITYRYTDTSGNEIVKEVTVHVQASQSKLEGHDSTLIAGPNQKWTAQDNYDAGTGASGKAIDFNQVTVEGTADPTKAGDYPITYRYTDEAGNEIVKEVTVHVQASQSKLEGHDSTLIAGPNQKWTAQDNYDAGTDASGKTIDFSQVTVEGTVDPTKAGDYPITYRYTDEAGNEIVKEVTVHVQASQSKLEGHDSTLIAGPNQKWTAQDNYDAGADASGKALDFSQVTVEGTVDPTKAGDYPITYGYTDAEGNEVVKEVTVHVQASQSKLEGHDSTLIAGPDQKWTAQDNYDAGTDASGKAIDFSQVTVEGAVDPTKAGDYSITYRYTDEEGNEVVKEVTVHVLKNKQTIDGSDYTMDKGGKKPTPADFKPKATDASGKSINVTADFSQVDFDQAGDYAVTLRSTDGQTKMVMLHITAKDLISQNKPNENAVSQNHYQEPTKAKAGQTTNESVQPLVAKANVPVEKAKTMEVNAPNSDSTLPQGSDQLMVTEPTNLVSDLNSNDTQNSESLETPNVSNQVVNDATPMVENQADPTSDNSSIQPISTNEKTYPKTGEQTNQFGLLGILILGLTSGIWFKKKR